MRGLKKPTRPAWVVNRLALRHPEPFRRLTEAADRLRAGGGGPEGLRAAAAAERDAVAALMELAGEELGSEAPAAALDRVRETLQAVAADDEIRREAEAGRLVREQRVATIGGLVVDAGSGRRPARRGDKGKAKARGAAKAKAKAKTAATQDRERERRLRKAQAEIERLRRRSEVARGRERRARAALERAEAKAEAARETHARAEAELASASEELDAGEARASALEDSGGGRAKA